MGGFLIQPAEFIPSSHACWGFFPCLVCLIAGLGGTLGEIILRLRFYIGMTSEILLAR